MSSGEEIQLAGLIGPPVWPLHPLVVAVDPKARVLQVGRVAHQSQSALEPFCKDDGAVSYGDAHLMLYRKTVEL